MNSGKVKEIVKRDIASKESEVFSTVDYTKTIFNPRWFLENMLWIVTKEGKLTRFTLNKEQSTMMDYIEFCWFNDIPIRLNLLKARQIGATTFFVALGFWFASMNKNKTYALVAHRYDSAESIFQKCKLFYNNLPKEMQPSTVQLSSEGIRFDKKNGKGINSAIKFATAGDGVYRGQTFGFLHESERAFFDGVIQSIDNSLSPTVADVPKTIRVRESTANGYNHFKDEWDRAERGESGWKNFFFGWQDHEEYQTRVPKGYVFSEEDLKVQNELGITNEQLFWRRLKIDNDFGGNTIHFQQEYPATATEAFIASGGSVFSSETIMAGYNACYKHEYEYEIKSVPMQEKLLIWEKPQVRKEDKYVQTTQWNVEAQRYDYVDTDVLLEELYYATPYTLGIDTSGLGSNFNQIVVVDNVTKKMVARWSKKDLNEQYIAKVAVEIAKMYNNAKIAPETNYSHEICNYILEEGYDNIYIKEDLSKIGSKVTGNFEYGWKTTTASKPPLISALRSKVTENPALVPDKEFWYEAEYFLMEDAQKNIMNSASGHFDDIIIALAIAEYVSDSFQSEQRPRVIKDKKDVREVDVLSAITGGIVKSQKNSGKTILKKGVYRNRA